MLYQHLKKRLDGLEVLLTFLVHSSVDIVAPLVLPNPTGGAVHLPWALSLLSILDEHPRQRQQAIVHLNSWHILTDASCYGYCKLRKNCNYI